MNTQQDSLYRPPKQIAYPTIVWAVAAAVGYAIASVAGARGQLDMGWIVLVNTVAAYLLFTPMHEAAHFIIMPAPCA